MRVRHVDGVAMVVVVGGAVRSAMSVRVGVGVGVGMAMAMAVGAVGGGFMSRGRTLGALFVVSPRRVLSRVLL